MTPFEQAERELRLRGVIIRNTGSELVVEHGGHREAFERLEDALAYGRTIEVPKPVRHPRKPSTRPKAVNKRLRRRHWERMVARIRRGEML